jgi:hypothetical protein
LALSKETIFAIHEQPVRYTFVSQSKNDTISFFIRARQYNDSFYDNIYNNYYAENQEEYSFVYKGVWFTGNVFQYDKDYFSDFFRLTGKDKKLNIYFPDKKVYYWDSDLFISYYDSNYAMVRSRIYNNAIVEIYGGIGKKIDVIYHTIRKYETLSELVEKYRTTEKRIRALNPQLLFDDKLPVGKEIRVQ